MRPRAHPICRAVMPIAIAVLFFGSVLYVTGTASADPLHVWPLPELRTMWGWRRTSMP